MRRIAVLDAPSNLGLRPPTASSVPGCAKAPGALRDHGLIPRLSARDAGCVTPPRYDPGDWRPGDGVAHAEQIAWYSRRLADRIGTLLDAGEFPVVLGGDCSVLLGSALASSRLSSEMDGRVGLVFIDGHADFRHPGNASYVGAAAGEDLALVTGRGQSDLTNIEHRGPYFRDSDVVVLGIRTHDEHRVDLQAAGIAYRAVPQLRAEGPARSAQWARRMLNDCLGYWVHIDVDVLDPAVMPAVDAPEPGGIAYAELELLLSGLVATPHCLGVEITVFDPDYDLSGGYAAELVETLVAGLNPAVYATPVDRAAPAPVSPAVPQLPASPAPLPRAPLSSPVSPALAPVSPAVAPVSPAVAPVSQSVPPGLAPALSPPVEASLPLVPAVVAAEEFDVGEDSDRAAESGVAGELAAAAPAVRAGAAAPAVRAESAGVTESSTRVAGDEVLPDVTEPPAAAVPEPADPPRRPVRPAPQRAPLDRMNLSDLLADRAALSRRRTGGIPLGRREAPAEETTDSAARSDREAGPTGDPEPATSGADERPATDPARRFAGLAEQVRAAGQVPAARVPADPPPRRAPADPQPRRAPADPPARPATPPARRAAADPPPRRVPHDQPPAETA
jgi:arginase